MSSPATTRASASVPIVTSSRPEVNVARTSVSSPTRLSHCDSTETRWGQKPERARSPHEGKTAEKAEEPREGTAVAKPEVTMTAGPESAPTPLSTSHSTSHSASNKVISMKGPPE